MDGRKRNFERNLMHDISVGCKILFDIDSWHISEIILKIQMYSQNIVKKSTSMILGKMLKAFLQIQQLWSLA